MPQSLIMSSKEQDTENMTNKYVFNKIENPLPYLGHDARMKKHSNDI